MSTTTETSATEAVKNATMKVADGVSYAAGQVNCAAAQASDGVVRFRALVRGQPITMALMLLGAGYLLGTHLPRRRD